MSRVGFVLLGAERCINGAVVNILLRNLQWVSVESASQIIGDELGLIVYLENKKIMQSLFQCKAKVRKLSWHARLFLYNWFQIVLLVLFLVFHLMYFFLCFDFSTSLLFHTFWFKQDYEFCVRSNDLHCLFLFYPINCLRSLHFSFDQFRSRFWGRQYFFHAAQIIT